MAIKNVVLVGAGGNIGPFILSSLEQANFTVTILSRKSSKSTFPGHKVVKVSDDYPHAELVSAFKGQDAIVATVSLHPEGKLDGGIQERLIDAAIEAGVKRFLPSEFGGDARNEQTVALVPLFTEKLRIVKYLEERKGKIDYTAVLTGPFFDFGLKTGFMGIDLKENKATLTDGGSNEFTITTESQIGEAVAAVLKHDQETANKHVSIASFTVTQQELVAAVEKEGRQLTIENQKGPALIENSRAGFEAGNLYALYGLVQAAVFTKGYGADMSADASKWKGILGLKGLDLQTETKRVLAEAK